MTHRRRRTTPTLAALLILAGAGVGLTACSNSSPSGQVPAAARSLASVIASEASAIPTDGASLPSAPAGSGPAQKTSSMRIRVVNLYSPASGGNTEGSNGPPVPGPALDIYDAQLTGQAATPVATAVAYGSASDYFTTHEAATSIGNPPVELFALPAGEDPTTKFADAQAIGGGADDGSGAQLTILLTADNSGIAESGPLARLSFSDRVEKGDDGNGSKAPVAPTPPSGQGEILVDTSAAPDVSEQLYLLIDASCAPPINGDPNVKGLPEIFAASSSTITSSFAIFPTAPGSHQVSLVGDTDSTTPTCAQLTAKQSTTTVDITAGQQVEAYVYGTSATDLHLALAPIAS